MEQRQTSSVALQNCIAEDSLNDELNWQDRRPRTGRLVRLLQGPVSPDMPSFICPEI